MALPLGILALLSHLVPPPRNEGQALPHAAAPHGQPHVLQEPTQPGSVLGCRNCLGVSLNYSSFSFFERTQEV